MPYDNSKYSNYNNYNRSGGGSYSPKKPVKSFMDLEIYQKALEASVAVSKISLPGVPLPTLPAIVSKSRKGQGCARSTPDNVGSGTAKGKSNIGTGTTEAESLIIHNMLPCALGLPHLIAEAHSYRFGTGTDCLVLLEKTMVNCNKMMVYLEQVRDICQTGLEHEFFEELIKKYLYIRRKTLNLQRVWKKYIEHPDGNFGFGAEKKPPL